MWLPIDEGFPDHPKTLHLCRLLKDPNAGMYLMRLWVWACRSAPGGDLTGIDAEDIEPVLRWRGPPGACFAALAAAGFIDVEPDGTAQIHDWDENGRTGAAIEKMETGANRAREAAAERKRRERARKAEAEAAGRDGHTDVTRDSHAPVTPRHAPKTGQEEKGQDRKEPAQSDVRAGDPTTPGPVALARAVAVAVEQAGELVAAQAPRARATGYDVVQLYGRVRAECVQGCSPWDTPSGNSLQKADAFVASLREENAALLEPTMREFFRQAQDPNARPPPNPLRATRATFGFGAWLGDFPDLCQEVRGNRKPGGKAAGPKYCAFHGRERSAGKRAPKHEWRADCPECRHVDARGSKREGEPTSIGEMFQGIQPGG